MPGRFQTDTQYNKNEIHGHGGNYQRGNTKNRMGNSVSLNAHYHIRIWLKPEKNISER